MGKYCSLLNMGKRDTTLVCSGMGVINGYKEDNEQYGNKSDATLQMATTDA